MEKEPFADALRRRILLFDGAMGTEIQRLDPKPGDFPNDREGFNDGLTLTHPEWIEKIHRSYLQAGSDCIETNTFGSNKIKLDEYGFGDQTVSMNTRAAQLAAGVASEFSSPHRYVVGCMGPTGFLPGSGDPDLGQMPIDQIRDAFALQAEGLVLGGADALLIETSQDILEVKMAIEGSQQAITKTGKKTPIIANVTLDPYGRMLLGTDIQAAYTTLSGMGIDVFGLNCSTGPQEMTPSIRWLDEQDECDLLVVPNAGMPENQGGRAVYKMGPQEMASSMDDFMERYGRVRIIGGCCGTNPEHIAAMRRVIDARA